MKKTVDRRIRYTLRLPGVAKAHLNAAIGYAENPIPIGCHNPSHFPNLTWIPYSKGAVFSMHISNKRVGRRTLAALVTSVSVTLSSAAVLPMATAQEPIECSQINPRPSNGQGELQIEGNNVVAPESVVTVVGSDFAERPEGGSLAFKINDNHSEWGTDQVDSQLDPISGPETEVYLSAKHITDGSFKVQFKLPAGLKDGKNVIRALGGGDGGPHASRILEFYVNSGDATDGHCGIPVPETPSEPAQPSEEAQPTDAAQPTETAQPSNPAEAANAAVSVQRVSTSGRSGVTSVGLGLSGFSAGAQITAKLGETAVQFAQGRQTIDSVTVGEDGTVNATVSLPRGTVPAGTYTVTLISDKDGEKQVEFTTEGVASVRDRSQGGKDEVSVANVPDGAKITFVGVGEKNWLSDAQVQSAAAAENNRAVIADVMIPLDAPIAQEIRVGFTVNGETSFVSGGAVTANNAEVNPGQYGRTTALLPSGLYQSAVNLEENTLFVTRAVGRPPVKESTLYKLDADTLEVLGQTAAAPVDPQDESKGLFAVYGVGLDNVNGLVWVTNTRQNTVAVYKQSDLSLVKQFEPNLIDHPRDVRVDETTGLAYVSSPRGGEGGKIGVFDLDNGLIDTIEVKDGEKTFGGTMSLDFDIFEGNLVTVSLNTPQAAIVNVRSGEVKIIDLPADKVQSASGAAWDADRKEIWIANQGTSNVVVVSAETGEVVAEVPTGSGALSVAYDADADRAYVANRGGGTVTVIDAKTKKVTNNLSAGSLTNNVTVGFPGTFYAVAKGSIEKDGQNYNPVIRFADGESDQGTVEAPTSEPAAPTSESAAPTSEPAAPTSEPAAPTSEPAKPGKDEDSNQGKPAQHRPVFFPSRGGFGGLLGALLGGFGIFGLLFSGFGFLSQHLNLHFPIFDWFKALFNR